MFCGKREKQGRRSNQSTLKQRGGEKRRLPHANKSDSLENSSKRRLLKGIRPHRRIMNGICTSQERQQRVDTRHVNEKRRDKTSKSRHEKKTKNKRRAEDCLKSGTRNLQKKRGGPQKKKEPPAGDSAFQDGTKEWGNKNGKDFGSNSSRGGSIP